MGLVRDVVRGVVRDIVNPVNERFGGWSTQWYGFEIDQANSSPSVTRIASDMDAHKAVNLPVHNSIKACILADDGSVVYYLDPDDWSKKENGSSSSLDGTDGQVMIEWPDFYYKVENPSAGVYRLKISTGALSGFTLVPKHYVSAFEPTVYRPGSKLASVINISTDYRGGNNGQSAWDADDNTQLGRPASDHNRPTFRTYARNRGTGWNCYGANDHKWLYWLFVIEYATRNSQAVVNSSLDSNGYRQGGLGDGVTTIVSGDWNTFSSYYPFVPCGASNSLASGSGEVDYVVTGWPGGDVTVKVPRYRGHENPFGHIWKICDGVNIKIQADGDGGESQLWIAEDPSDWNDSNYTGYTNRGLIPRANGYQSKALWGDGAEFCPSEASGSSATYYCDYFYISIPGSGEDLRMLLVGGNAAIGAYAGFATSNATYSPSTDFANFGSRLRFEPE